MPCIRMQVNFELFAHSLGRLSLNEFSNIALIRFKSSLDSALLFLQRAEKNLALKQFGKWDKEIASHLHTRGQVLKGIE